MFASMQKGLECLSFLLSQHVLELVSMLTMQEKNHSLKFFIALKKPQNVRSLTLCCITEEQYNEK